MSNDWLSTALRDIAEEDARRGAAPMDAPLAAAFRAAQAPRPSPAAFAIGLTLAATLVTGVGIGLWQITRAAHDPAATRQSRTEITTAFLPLMFSAVPATDAQMVRLALPRWSLAAAGLLPIDAVESDAKATVWADVIVGEDGLARAIRFVRIAAEKSN